MVTSDTPLARCFLALCQSLTSKEPPQPSTGAWPFPNTTSRSESWAFNLSQSDFDTAQLDASQWVKGAAAGDCYYYDWAELAIWDAFEAEQEAIAVALTLSMRAAEAAKHLKEPRRALARYEKMLAGLEDEAESTAPSFQLEEEEKHLIATNWWLRHQLATKTTPWSPGGLASAVQLYLRACSRCWENVRIDGEGNTQLAGQRSLIWRDQVRFIRVLRKALVP